MHRRKFLGTGLAGGALAGGAAAAPQAPRKWGTEKEAWIERPAAGRPHEGKMTVVYTPGEMYSTSPTVIAST